MVQDEGCGISQEKLLEVQKILKNEFKEGLSDWQG